jgi:anti-sigma factor RsiW
MDRDDLEFAISQYVDGTLVGGKREALEARLRLDPAARAVLADFRALDAELKALPLPDVRWDALASQISSAIAVAEAPAQASYRIADYRWTRWVAAAAAVLIAAGTAFVALRGGGDAKPINIVIQSDPKPAPAPIEITLVNASQDEAPVATPVVVVIGPGDSLKDQPTLNRYASDVISRPSQVLIASSASPVQDISLSPF